MDFSKLSRSEWLGLAASALLVIAVLFLPWFGLATDPRGPPMDGSGFLCGAERVHLRAFGDLPDPAAGCCSRPPSAPWILAYIVVRGHKLSWPPGELTMTVGFTAFILIAYNGIVDQPGTGNQEIGIDQGDRLLRRPALVVRHRRRRHRPRDGDREGRASQGPRYGLSPASAWESSRRTTVRAASPTATSPSSSSG